jgi:hypothetical protein
MIMKKPIRLSLILLAGLLSAYMTPFLALATDFSYIIGTPTELSDQTTTLTSDEFSFGYDYYLDSIDLYTTAFCGQQANTRTTHLELWGSPTSEFSMVFNLVATSTQAESPAQCYYPAPHLDNFTFDHYQLNDEWTYYLKNIIDATTGNPEIPFGSYTTSLYSPTLGNNYIKFYLSTPSSTITTTYPENNENSQAPFLYWQGDFEYVELNSSTIYLSVWVATSSSMINPIIDTKNIDISTMPSGGSWQIDNTMDLLPNTIYYIKSFFDDPIIGNVASSSVVSFMTSPDFDITPPLNNNFYDPTITPTTASSTPSVMLGSCENSSGIINYSSCVLFSWIFTPSASVLENWKNLKNDLSQKPPFGYVSVYLGAVNDLTTATTTKAFQLADLSSLNSDFFYPLRAVLSMALWISFLMYLYKRLKHIQL